MSRARPEAELARVMVWCRTSRADALETYFRLPSTAPPDAARWWIGRAIRLGEVVDSCHLELRQAAMYALVKPLDAADRERLLKRGLEMATFGEPTLREVLRGRP